MKKLGLYIHIPFCIKKCNYCDFTSFRVDKNVISNYIKSLKSEILLYKEVIKDYEIKTIFLGGGTPSILSTEEISDLLSSVYNSFTISLDPEITMESNPGTLSKEKLSQLYELGINRLSIGLQSLNNDILSFIGRIHCREDFLRQYEYAQGVGFNNINIDLIYGLPNQDMKDWVDTISEVVSLSPQHISAYGLKIEEGTKFWESYKKGKLILPDDENEREMYHFTIDYLKENGYNQYEISNFSMQGYECKHNLIYWSNSEYLGLGVSAHSYISSVRYSNTSNMQDYLKCLDNKKLPIITEEKKTLEDRVFETMFLGLRLVDGINIKSFTERLGVNPLDIYKEKIDKLEGLKLIEVSDNSIKLTRYGMDVSNQVFVEFIMD